MSKLISFLEYCGTDATLASSDKTALLAAAREAGLNENEVAALGGLDVAQLEGMLSARTRITCFVFPARDPDPDKDDDGKEEAPEEPSEPKGVRLVA